MTSHWSQINPSVPASTEIPSRNAGQTTGDGLVQNMLSPDGLHVFNWMAPYLSIWFCGYLGGTGYVTTGLLNAEDEAASGVAGRAICQTPDFGEYDDCGGAVGLQQDQAVFVSFLSTGAFPNLNWVGGLSIVATNKLQIQIDIKDSATPVDNAAIQFYVVTFGPRFNTPKDVFGKMVLGGP